MTGDGNQWPAKCLNVSITGALVEFEQERILELSKGQLVTLHLTLGDQSVKLNAGFALLRRSRHDQL